jgi:hypothetical protein
MLSSLLAGMLDVLTEQCTPLAGSGGVPTNAGVVFNNNWRAHVLTLVTGGDSHTAASRLLLLTDLGAHNGGQCHCRAHA